MFGIPSFIARLVPVTTLKSEFLMEQLMMLLQIIDDAGGLVFLIMTDDLSLKQKLFNLLKRIHTQKTVATIVHPLNNMYFKLMTLAFDPIQKYKKQLGLREDTTA